MLDTNTALRIFGLQISSETSKKRNIVKESLGNATFSCNTDEIIGKDILHRGYIVCQPLRLLPGDYCITIFIVQRQIFWKCKRNLIHVGSLIVKNGMTIQ